MSVAKSSLPLAKEKTIYWKNNRGIDSHIPRPLKNKSSGKVDIEAVVKPYIVESPALRKTLHVTFIWIQQQSGAIFQKSQDNPLWGSINVLKSNQVDLDLFLRSQRSQKVQEHTRLKFWPQKPLCKVWKQLKCFLRSYCVHKLRWPWPSLHAYKGHRKVKTEDLSKILVSGTPLWSMKAIGILIEELSCSQAKLTLT